MNENIIIIHPKLLNDYIDFLEKACVNMQESQSNVEKFFLKLGEVWQDPIYNLTGDCLADIAKLLKRVFDSMRASIISTTEYFNEWLTIQKMTKYSRPKIRAGEFYSVLKKGSYKMDTFKDSNVDALPDMKNFITELGTYITETARSISLIEKQHKEVGDQKTWYSKQYYQLGEILQSIDQEIKKQLIELNGARDELIKTYKAILELNEKKI